MSSSGFGRRRCVGARTCPRCKPNAFRELNDSFKGRQILGFQPIEFADKDVERMGEGERDVTARHRPGAATPARAGAKTQFEAGLKMQSTASLTQTRRLDERGQVFFVVVGKDVDVAAEEGAVHRELQRGRSVDRNVKGPIAWQCGQELFQETARRSGPINVRRPPVVGI